MSDKKLSERLHDQCLTGGRPPYGLDAEEVPPLIDAVRALERENHILNVRLEAVQKQVAASAANVARLQCELAGAADWLLSLKRMLTLGDK